MVEAVLLLDLLHFLLRGMVAGCGAVGPFDTEGVVLVLLQVFVDLGELLVSLDSSTLSLRLERVSVSLVSSSAGMTLRGSGVS